MRFLHDVQTEQTGREKKSYVILVQFLKEKKSTVNIIGCLLLGKFTISLNGTVQRTGLSSTFMKYQMGPIQTENRSFGSKKPICTASR